MIINALKAKSIEKNEPVWFSTQGSASGNLTARQLCKQDVLIDKPKIKMSDMGQQNAAGTTELTA